MKRHFLVIAFIGALLLTLIYWISGFIFELPEGQQINFWGFIANYLISAVLGFYIINSGSSLLRRSFFVFLIYFIIGHFNLLIEAYIFNITDRRESSDEILRGFMMAFLFSPAYVHLFNYIGKCDLRFKLQFKPRSILNWSWRILLGDILYLFLYIGAGLILSISSPQIMEFYEGKIPPFDLMIETQLFLRGFLFMGIALLILRTMSGSARKKAVYIGLVFSILGAIAPLIPANDLMPTFVRWGHGIEVSISNFIYGFLLGYLLGQLADNKISDSP